MKKTLALLIAGLMALPLAACEQEEKTVSDAETSITISETQLKTESTPVSSETETSTVSSEPAETSKPVETSKPAVLSKPAQTSSKHTQTAKPNNDGFVPTLETTDVAAIKAHTDRIDDAIGNAIDGSFENFTGSYYYNIEGGVVTSSSFRTTPMDVNPSANAAGERVFNTAAINAGYAKTEALMSAFFAKGYKVTFVYCMYTDGALEELSALPLAREMIEKHVSLIDTNLTGYKDIQYLAEMTSPSGKPMCMQIYFSGWHTITINIYNHKGTPRCTHVTDDKWVSDQGDGTHATVCGECVCAIESTKEPHSDSDSDNLCDKCQARLVE